TWDLRTEPGSQARHLLLRLSWNPRDVDPSSDVRYVRISLRPRGPGRQAQTGAPPPTTRCLPRAVRSPPNRPRMFPGEARFPPFRPRRVRRSARAEVVTDRRCDIAHSFIFSWFPDRLTLGLKDQPAQPGHNLTLAMVDGANCRAERFRYVLGSSALHPGHPERLPRHLRDLDPHALGSPREHPSLVLEFINVSVFIRGGGLRIQQA